MTFQYNSSRFITILEDLFNAKHLNRLHELTTEDYTKLFEVSKDSSTIFHKKFYDKYRAGWEEMEKEYLALIDRLLESINEDFLYQKFPTFRVHLPNNLAVGAFHTDAEFGHPNGEINYIIPLTNSYGTASCWVESSIGSNDFYPMNMITNQLIEFEGNKLRHGNKVNETGMTRVSMDFRILPISKYNEHEASESVTLKTKFKEGEYYKRFTKHAN